jgi:hypothetical protein
MELRQVPQEIHGTEGQREMHWCVLGTCVTSGSSQSMTWTEAVNRTVHG